MNSSNATSRAMADFRGARSRASRYAAGGVLTLLLCLGLGRGLAQSDSPSEYQVKAAFLYNFGKFVEWPDNVFPSPQAPLVIGVYGRDPFGGDLERIVSGKTIAGHPVAVHYVSSVTELKTCHIVFVSMAQEKKAADIAAALEGARVLTVTENVKRFAGSGFIINFVTQDSHVSFQINNTIAMHDGLPISSKLLSLARPLN